MEKKTLLVQYPTVSDWLRNNVKLRNFNNKDNKKYCKNLENQTLFIYFIHSPRHSFTQFSHRY